MASWSLYDHVGNLGPVESLLGGSTLSLNTNCYPKRRKLESSAQQDFFCNSSFWWKVPKDILFAQIETFERGGDSFVLCGFIDETPDVEELYTLSPRFSNFLGSQYW